MKPMTVISLIFGLTMMVPGIAHANDATSSSPPGVTMESAGGVPAPPVCNTSSQMLHWNGSAWQCIAAVSRYAKGSIVGGVRTSTNYQGGATCPAGASPAVLESTSFGGYTSYKYFCYIN